MQAYSDLVDSLPDKWASHAPPPLPYDTYIFESKFKNINVKVSFGVCWAENETKLTLN